MRCFYCNSPMWNPSNDKSHEFLVRAGFNQRRTDGRYQHPVIGISSTHFKRHSRLTKEHLIRRADGGIGIPNNIVRACAWCNSNRGEASVSEHKDRIVAMVAAGQHPVARAYQQDATCSK